MTEKTHRGYKRKIEIILGDRLIKAERDEIGIKIETYDVTKKGGLKEDFYTSLEEIEKKYVFEKLTFKMDDDWCAIKFRQNLMDVLLPILSENIYEHDCCYKFDSQLETIKFYVGDKRINPEFLLDLMESFSVYRAELKWRSGDFVYPWVLKLSD